MRTVVVHRALPVFLLEDLGAPSAPTCQCEVPDLQPVGSWWPTEFVACAQCGRAVLE